MERKHCEEFLERLDAFLGATLDEAIQQRLEAHVCQCQRCRSLLEAMRHPAAGEGDPSSETFLAGVLQRTSGSPCTRAESLLPAWVDSGLAGPEAELLPAHLDHCAECAGLAAVLAALREDLPSLAETDPGPHFTAQVMSATGRQKQSAHTWEERLAAVWQRLLARPRLAWEFATAMSFALVLLCGLPFSPFRPLPQQALAVVQVDPVRLVRGVATEIEPALSGFGRHAWEHTGEPLKRAAAARARRFATEHEEAAETWKQIRADLSEVGAGIGQRNFARMTHGLQLLGEDLGQLFDGPTETDAEEGS